TCTSAGCASWRGSSAGDGRRSGCDEGRAMARRASASAFELIRRRLAAAEARFAALDEPGRADEAGRVLHGLLSGPGWQHPASLPRLRAVGATLRHGAARLLAAEGEESPWRLVRAYTGFEIACRALGNHTGDAGLPPALFERLAAYALPEAPELPAVGGGASAPPEVEAMLGPIASEPEALREWREQRG